MYNSNRKSKFRRNFNQKRNYSSRDQSGSGSIRAFIAQSQQKFAQSPQPESVVTRSFVDYSFHPQLGANIQKLGFLKPTHIQEEAIDPILEGKNVLGIAQTGTGKTGAFLIPIVNKLLHDTSQKVVIVAPTRELAVQIQSVFRDLTQGTQLYAVNCIGGSNIRRQIEQLRRNNHLVIGTPGRILDLIERQKLSLSGCKTVVLDEVDQMLDMGFVHDIKKILSRTPENKQSLYFSATMNPRVSRLIREFSTNVHEVKVQQEELSHTISHEMIRYQSEENKFNVLYEVLQSNGVSKSIIFGRTKHGVKRLMFKLRDSGFKAESIHGNKTQQQRQKALISFKKSQVDILVATDVAARGIDVDDISHVINYDLPQSLDDYIHRTGRTGRAGKKGTAVTFVK